MKILVTGATGKLGTLVMKNLLELESADNLSVSVRDINKANDLKEKGIDVRYGDFDKVESLKEAFKDIDKLLIISTDGDNETRIRQHKNAVDAAKYCGVKFIAYTSVGNAKFSKLPLAIVHKETEMYIKNSGIPYAFLRNNWYLENEINSFKEAIQTGTWTNSIGDARVAWAPRKDYAKACAKVLINEIPENKIYELSRKPISTKELVSYLEKVSNKSILINNIDLASYSQVLKSNGLPEPVVNFIISLQEAIKDSALDIESKDFEELIGDNLSSIEEDIREILEYINN